MFVYREVVLSDFALRTVDMREKSSYSKSFAVDKLNLSDFSRWLSDRLASTWKLIGLGGGGCGE